MLDDVLCFSHLRWGFVYQRPNHLMSRCARDRRVFFIEEPVFDSGRPRLVLDPVLDNLTVITPHLRHGTPGSEAAVRQRELIAELRTKLGIRSPLAWFYTPMAFDVEHGIDARAVVYDCMDELSAFAGAPRELGQRERDLFARADLVFTGGHSLFEAKRAHHPSVHAFPSSVDADHFSSGRSGRLPEPADQKKIAGPRVGFFGVIDERMDIDLLARMAGDLPECSFVLVGPVVKIDPATLPRLSNLHYLGPKTYEELPAYLAGWDVAMMPFAQNDATRFISPTKTLEYLAGGKPVVSTPIRDVITPFGEMGLVRVGAGG
ncbi:MAG: glycosyltransferase, partial [Polyangiaceae bacterium]|nr:glycosyltransferase [Polyangiaceae bacterium]